MRITIEEYENNEKKSLCELPNRAVESFSPVTFHSVNYPTRVRTHNELIRYVDTMHEAMTWEMFDYFKRTYSEDEAAIIKEVCNDTAELTKKEFGKTIRPINAPLGAIYLWRIIQNIIKSLKVNNISVFEIGPGSGYLGAFMIKSGFTYACMDNTQAFYLWQNLLYDHIAGGDFIDYANIDVIMASRKEGNTNPNDARVCHYPWWIYSNIYKESIPFGNKYDIVVCNRVLGELSEIALGYILKTSKLMLKGSELGLIVFEGLGSLKINSFDMIMLAFRKYGFVPILGNGFYCFTLKDSKLSRYACDYFFLELGQERFSARIPGMFILSWIMKKFHTNIINHTPFYNAGQTNGQLKVPDFIKLNHEESPLDYKFLRYAGIEEERY